MYYTSADEYILLYSIQVIQYTVITCILCTLRCILCTLRCIFLSPCWHVCSEFNINKVQWATDSKSCRFLVLFLYEASQKTAAAGSESTGKHYVTDEIDSSIIVPLTKTTNLLLLSHVFLFFLFRTLFRAAVLLFSLILLSPDIQRRTIVIGRPSVHASVITLTRHNKGHLLSPFFSYYLSRYQCPCLYTKCRT